MVALSRAARTIAENVAARLYQLLRSADVEKLDQGAAS